MMTKFKSISRLSLLALAFVITAGCAEKRPTKHILPERQRLEKAIFTSGEFYYNITVIGASADAEMTHIGDQTFGDDSLVRFQITENYLQANKVDSRYKDKTTLSNPLFSIPISKHVDIQQKKNADDEITHEQEANTKDRLWNKRKYAEFKFAKTTFTPTDYFMLSLYEKQGCIKEISSDLVKFDYDSHFMNITLLKTYNHTGCGVSSRKSFTAKIKLSLIKKRDSKDFKKISYSKQQQKKVGFFKTTAKVLDKYNYTEEKEYAAHWNRNKMIVYYLSPGFPMEYKPLVQKVFDHWNETFEDETVLGKPMLELRDNSGQELGDIRYNFIVWISDPVEAGLLGYGPSRHDPRTGEMVNANVYLFGGTIRHSLYAIQKDHEYRTKKSGSFKLLSHGSQKSFSTGVSSSSSMASKKHDTKKFDLDPSFNVKDYFQEITDKKTLKGALFHFKNLSGRCYYPEMHGKRVGAWYAKGLSEEEIFKRLVSDTLVHELGHTLGLRHNFKGSVDKKHHISSVGRTSSVMDYLDLEDSEGGRPGPYDKAALAFVYGKGFDFHENYLYCSDEQVLRDPYCNRWDQGTTASEIATYLRDSYIRTYARRNLKGKRRHLFNSKRTFNRYTERLMFGYYYPMRGFLDTFDQMRQTYRTHDNFRLDTQTLREQLKDLEKAVTISYNFFQDIIVDTNREYFDISDADNPGELYSIGTRIDKMLAADILLNPFSTINNLSRLGSSYFNYLGTPVLRLISSLSTNLRVPEQVVISLVRKFLVYVPRVYNTSSTADLFKMERNDWTKENEKNFSDNRYAVEYMIDERNNKIYSASKWPLWNKPQIYGPMAHLIARYNELKTRRDIVIALSTRKRQPLKEDFTILMGNINRFKSLLSKDKVELKKLEKKDIDVLERLLSKFVTVKPKKRSLLVDIVSMYIPRKAIVLSSRERLISAINEIDKAVDSFRRDRLTALSREIRSARIKPTKKQIADFINRLDQALMKAKKSLSELRNIAATYDSATFKKNIGKFKKSFIAMGLQLLDSKAAILTILIDADDTGHEALKEFRKLQPAMDHILYRLQLFDAFYNRNIRWVE